jgi:alpha-soluble NSF attachment protein
MELYDKAAAQFKIAKQWDAAGDAYVKMAECAEKIGNEVEAVGAYSNAAKAYKNGNTSEAIKIFRIAAQMQMTRNQFQQAGKLLLEVANIEEKDLKVQAAIKSYTAAADCFLSEGSVPSENQALLKVADLSAGEGDYKGAIKIYEKVASVAVESSLLKYSAHSYFFKAGLWSVGNVCPIWRHETVGS